ncbi:hypothetical protein N7493_001636 [Penicillium malachiteum]|uniref:Peptidase S8/S53 domain-containing protein n=1 Tax=Penicillium malachiteum TaxID=1324776 RepID=A0AAD6N0I9_9EURO|nr:hypothetical protein N7493_001636 [Penicillium malachiteum]
MFSAVHNDLGSWGSAFFMKGPPVEIHSGVSSKYTKHFCIEVSDVDSKLEKLFQFFSITTLGSTIVFVKSRKDMLKIFNRLTDDGWPVSIWWGSFPYSSSNDTTWFDKLCFDSRDFLFGSVKVMLASLDLQPKLNIWCRSVFLYDTPDTFGTYVHCVGRASYYRTSYVFTFIIQESEWDLSKLRAIETYFSTCSVHLKWTDMDGLEDLEWMMGDIKRQSLAIQIDKPGVQDGNGAVNQRSSLMDSIYANGVTAQNIKDALSPETSNSGPSNANPLSGKARDDSKKNADIHEGIHEVPKVPKAKSISAQRRHNKKDTSLTVASKASMKGKKKISGQKSPNVNPIDEDQLRVIPQGFFNELNDTIDGRLQFIEGEVPVRIAILDTGIDSNHEDFHKARPRRFTNDLQSEAADEEVPQKFRIKGRRNFCFDGAIDVKEKMIQEQDTNDCDGHGTQVAGIILRVAPNAELYIARICVGHDNTGSSISKDHPFRDPTPDVVAEALEWAIRQKVDIINMSLGFETSSKNVIQALKKAKNHNVLVLAAASNDGPIKDELAWPAKDPFLAIAIHSSKHGGRPSDTAADPQKGRYNFMVVGEDIISQRLSRKSGGFCLCTGSSFATPVATAMCALIIAFMRQELCEDEREATDAEIGAKCLWRVRNIDWMSRLLAEISKEREGFHLLHPKLFWRDYTDDRKRRPAAESRAQAWKMIEKALKHG